MKGENEFAVIIDGLRNVGIKVDDALWCTWHLLKVNFLTII